MFFDNDPKQLTFFDCNDEPIKNPAECESADASVWRMFIDGASRNNPGNAGAGFCLKRNETVKEEQGFFVGQRTNNQAEYFALLIGLYFAKEFVNKHEKLLIFSDSQLLVRQMTGIYKVRDPLLQRLKDISLQLMQSYNVTFCHVYREHNVRADFLANRGIDKMILMPKKFLDFLAKNDVA